MNEHGFKKRHYRLLLVDDRLGNAAAAGFFQYRLNEIFIKRCEEIKERYGEVSLKFSIVPEENIDNLEYRLKSEPFDLVLLDLNFQHSALCLRKTCEEVPKEERERTSGCCICQQLFDDKAFAHINRDEDKITPDRVYDELGAYWLKYKIRKFNPAIPVIIFTSKYQDDIAMASKYGLYGFEADYYEKTRLSVRDPKKAENNFLELLHKIIHRIRNYENAYFDRIEVLETREEEYLAARSRDYMQTLLWNVLTSCLRNDKDDKFAVVFLDFDGMKKVNETFGYIKTNEVIKNFTELLHDEIEKTWREIVSISHEGESFYKPVLGRFFRERGDEFLIFFPRILGKATVSDGKKGIIQYLEKLREAANTKEWQADLFRVKGNDDGNTRGLKLTVSMGLLVFPDDLSIQCLKQLRGLKKRAGMPRYDLENSWCASMSKIYSELTLVPQLLKDNAKLLGKNQFCYYHESRMLSGSKVRINPRVNVGIVFNEKEFDKCDVLASAGKGDSGLIKFLKCLTDEVAFDFDVIGRDQLEQEIAEMIKEDRHYHIFLLVGWKKIPKGLEKRSDQHGFILWGCDDVRKADVKKAWREMPSLRLFLNKKNGASRTDENLEWTIHDNNLARHDEMLTSVSHLRDGRNCFFGALKDLSDRNCNDEYFPRFVIQDAFHNKFGNLKEDVAIFSGRERVAERVGDLGNHTRQLIAFAKGLSIGLPQHVWIQRRISNKGGDDRYNIIVPIEVDTVAYKFLRLDAGRNLLKLQQYFNGFLRGFLSSNPDKAMADRVVERTEEMTSPEYSEKKGIGGVVLCRLPFFSPVSPNVYQEMTQPIRVRLDEAVREDGVL